MRGLSVSQKKAKNIIKSNATQIFLARFLLLLPNNWPRFCFEAVDLATDLMVGLAIDSIVSMALKITVGLLG